MNANNSKQLQLQGAAKEGNIDLLYAVIQDDPYILDSIDLIPFVETPLHVAAYMGHLQFATEIMMLKPSFALKLNNQGFSPIHLAMQNDQTLMVYRFLNLNKNLARVQGREGMTPLHFACQIGKVDLITNFLLVCPESIEYLTVRNETALHIAIKNGQYEALRVLVGWLETNQQRGAKVLENKILNQKDEAGNTVLHVSVLNTQIEELLFLVKTKCASEVDNSQTLTYDLKSKITKMDKLLIKIFRIGSNMSQEERSTLLIIFTLIATATYQSVLSPIGGVYQANAGDDNAPASSNSTISAVGSAGKSVMSADIFLVVSFFNMTCFLLSIIAMLILTPTRALDFQVILPVYYFAISYLLSLALISPTKLDAIIVSIVSLAVVVVAIMFRICVSLGGKTTMKLNKSVKALLP